MKDKIMNFPLIRFIINLRICQWAANNPVLSRFCNYEVISYLVCGVLTTIVSYVSYFLVRIFSGVLISQCISWVLAVAFAYVSNKIFVFLSIHFQNIIIDHILRHPHTSPLRCLATQTHLSKALSNPTPSTTVRSRFYYTFKRCDPEKSNVILHL